MLGSRDERKAMWAWVRRKQAGLKNERYEVKRRLETIDAETAYYARIERACVPNPCKACTGYGQIRHWIAQDESKLKTCETCKGTGEGPEKDVVTQLGEVPQ